VSGVVGPGWRFPTGARKAHYFPDDRSTTLSCCKDWFCDPNRLVRFGLESHQMCSPCQRVRARKSDRFMRKAMRIMPLQDQPVGHEGTHGETANA